MAVNTINGAFGDYDFVFANHPKDEERALEYLKYCIKANKSIQAVMEEAETYLKSNNVSPDHLDTELKNVFEKYAGWLHNE